MSQTWSERLAGAGLFVFNGVDVIAGIALTIYSLYIGTNHYAPGWLYGTRRPFVVAMDTTSLCGS